MPVYILVHVLIRTVILVVLCTLAIRSGYRIGFRDSSAGRPARIRIFDLDDNEEDDA